jgi:hypothetical protein
VRASIGARKAWRAWAAASAVGCAGALAIGCTKVGEGASRRDVGAAADGGADPGSVAAAADLAQGRASYGALCASCHGGVGQGGTAPALHPSSARDDAMRDRIARTMPLGAVGACDTACAERIVAWLFSLGAKPGPEDPASCTADEAPARALRLLTRAEWASSLTDLFGAPSGASACPATAFRFDAGARSLRSVHVAGSFNGWPGTLAAGGIAMRASGSVWSASTSLPAGTHAYKFVLDEREWLADPAAPAYASDGFGGQNAIVTVRCAAPAGVDAALIAEAAATLPRDVKPQGFFFDDHVHARLVTAASLTAAMAAAERVVAAADLSSLVGCNLSEAACAEGFLQRTMAKAWRRPVSAAEVTALRSRFPQERGEPGLRGAIVSILTSTGFLYRSEVGADGPGGQVGRSGALTGPEAAAALAFALTGAPPDAALTSKGADGTILDGTARALEARRLLETQAARTHLGRFVEAWLGTAALADADKSPALFPGFDDALRASMREEVRRFGASVLLDRRDLRALFGSETSFVDERLARHYGVAGVSGPAFREATLPPSRRSGVLTMGAVLATLAHSDQTSPVKRGAFLRTHLLCQEFGPPPPNAGGVPVVTAATTARERFAAHASDPSCASCHKYIDDLGFAFERFDAAGSFRTAEANGAALDTTGKLLDLERFGAGTSRAFADLPELAAAIAGSEASKACFTKQLWRFVHGREEASACAGHAARTALATSGDTLEAIVAMVASPAFLERR